MCGTWKWKILTKQSESSCSLHMMVALATMCLLPTDEEMLLLIFI